MREGQPMTIFFDRIRRLVSPALLVLVATLVSGLLTFAPRPFPLEASGIEHRIMSSLEPQYVRLTPDRDPPWHYDYGVWALDLLNPSGSTGGTPVYLSNYAWSGGMWGYWERTTFSSVNGCTGSNWLHWKDVGGGYWITTALTLASQA
jgi:hypothetical protein